MDNSTSNPQNDEFYVGYLPIPKGYRKFINALLVTLFLWISAMSVIIVTTMRDPGYARWETGAAQQWTGTLVESPYPMLIPDDSTKPAIFVVSMGKLGAHERLAPFYDKHVTLSGYELNRDGRLLIELEDEESAIALESSVPTTRSQTPVHVDTIRLTGEIIDGKCYLGAMKPGDGVGHRSCAVLCIRGGLPPMFAAETPDGSKIYYLLMIDGSTNYSEESLGLVGRRVSLTAKHSTLLGLPILDSSNSQITLHEN
ncbi:MAG: hypothetical protein P1U42_09840 [Phycisphaerales bacterium]|nr:hypothetical protein [Phycisphaerales bacterium]